MQKIINVNCIIISLILFNSFCYGQKRIEGTYLLEGMTPVIIVDGMSPIVYSFSKDGIFEYKEEGDVAISTYGKGHYFLTKDSLILDYNLTDVKIKGYHILKPYSNLTDTIELKIRVFDFEKKPLSDVYINLFLQDITDKKTNEKGELSYKLPLKKETANIFVSYNYLGYFFSYNRQWSHEIEIYLSKMSDFELGTAIKGAIQKYKIIKMKKDYFVVEQKNGIKQTFRKKKKSE